MLTPISSLYEHFFEEKDKTIFQQKEKGKPTEEIHYEL